MSHEWMRVSTRTFRHPGPPRGFFWWINPKTMDKGFDGIACIYADGWRGQFLYVYSDEGLVVVRSRHPPDDSARTDAGSFKDIETASPSAASEA